VLLGALAACVSAPENSVLIFAAAVLLVPPLIAFALWRHHLGEERSETAPESSLD
jgi:hypothetical protein